ncbi:MAG: endopeptidase La [Epulopiscium sp.]|nr:endopeptidase La [Candidatus Epulonipiscium sp.]
MKQTSIYTKMPLLALRGLTIFPNMILHFDVGRPKSTQALEQAMVNDQYIFLVAQKDAVLDEPTPEDLFTVGTISKVKQLLKLPGDTIRVLVEGVNRGKIHSFIQEEPYFMVEVEEAPKEEEVENIQRTALLRAAVETFEEYAKVNGKISHETLLSILSFKKPGQMADTIAANIHLELEQKQMILGSFDPEERLRSMITILKKEVDILTIQRSIQSQVKQNIDKTQREYYLREQLKVIQEELGDKEGIKGEIQGYKNKLKDINPPKEVENKVLQELDRMLKIPYGSSEGAVVRNYIEWVLDLPWSTETEESYDLKKAEDILNGDHYGLEKVKERILEYLAVRQMDSSLNSPILCLVGPPGVGKTSIAASIAKALNRKYVRISLGGVRDEAEIRGHRKTYVGAMPGRIIQGLKQAQTKNPLILLDEIDKMSNDFRGDPSAALLEVLDAEQNHKFRDHFIELPYDLSKVLFLATANTLQTIPRPLLDRLEIIPVSSYTDDEKLRIAMDFLLPKQVEKHGMQKSQLRLSESVMQKIIQLYTKEAGVRNLERTIGELCRKAVKEFITYEKTYVRVTEKNLEKYLGIPKYHYDKVANQADIGVARGLAWTSVGGDTLSIEVNTMKGTGKFELTGNMGDVMKESAKTAISYIRSKADQLGIQENFYKELDIHIHIPEGAVPKDGPSAGITMATAMISALTHIPVRNDVGMTGEITLRGRVLPIGGLKEKLLAARRAGIRTVIIPIDNQKDIEEVPERIRNSMKLVFVKSMDEVIQHSLTQTVF